MRSRRLGYVGYQIGLAFFLAALPGSSATTSISPARDRPIGIVLGVLVMWFVFDQIWPVRTSEALRKSLLRVREATQKIRNSSPESDQSEATGSFDPLELAIVHELAFAVRFEIGRNLKRELVLSRRLMHNIEASSAEFYLVALQLSGKWSDAGIGFKQE
jgi:multidrug resistance protein MdtO